MSFAQSSIVPSESSIDRPLATLSSSDRAAHLSEIPKTPSVAKPERELSPESSSCLQIESPFMLFLLDFAIFQLKRRCYPTTTIITTTTTNGLKLSFVDGSGATNCCRFLLSALEWRIVWAGRASQRVGYSPISSPFALLCCCYSQFWAAGCDHDDNHLVFFYNRTLGLPRLELSSSGTSF